MACRVCAWFCKRLGCDTQQLWSSFWDSLKAWEREHSNEYDLWSAEPEKNIELIEQGWNIEKTDREAAFRKFLEAADAGSAFAMEMVGWRYENGFAVSADPERALIYYHRAICARSWLATIKYARLLAKLGRFHDCESVLEDGVELGFIPAYYWLARLRYERSKTRRTSRQIRPLLEYAAGEGHPGAKLLLGQLMARGKFGLREMLGGFRFFREIRTDIG